MQDTACALCNAAWQNKPEDIAEVFNRVLHRDTWGLQQIIVACLSTGDQGMERNPYLKHKSNYQYFSEALCLGTTPSPDKQDTEAASEDNDDAVISQECL